MKIVKGILIIVFAPLLLLIMIFRNLLGAI